MYFFNSIILIFMIILFSFMIYNLITDNYKGNINKKILLFSCLVLIDILLILFNNDLVFLIFMDFSAFFSYFIKKNREAFLLSLVSMFYTNLFLNISFGYYLIYFLYFFLSFVIKDNKLLFKLLFLIKSFLTSFIYFLYYDHSVIGMLYLIFVLIVYYLLIELNYNIIKLHNNKKCDDSIIFKMAHEVKNPLAVCSGYLSMININDKEKLNRYIPIIKNETDRALTIMNDFLGLKRLTVEKNIMDICLLVEDVRDTVRLMFNNKNIFLEINECDDELFLEADYDRLKQIMINLIKNSYEANARKIAINIKEENDHIYVEVCDDGDGISSENMKKIGTIFYTTKPNGTGIGVNMSREIMKLHNGSLKYYSEKGKGTRAVLEFPNKLII